MWKSPTVNVIPLMTKTLRPLEQVRIIYILSLPLSLFSFLYLFSHSLTPSLLFSFLVQFINTYGHLSAELYPFYPFWGVLMFNYILLGCFWAVLSAIHWNEILQLQNYIGITFFLFFLSFFLSLILFFLLFFLSFFLSSFLFFTHSLTLQEV